jgi:hypothetical protein
MDDFETVEKEIGTYNTWPSYILKYLFCKPLTDYGRTILSAFFYGNGISLYTTLALVKACTPCFNLADRYAIAHLFTEWDISPTARSRERYFNLVLNEMRDLNGGKIKSWITREFPFLYNGTKALTG